MGIKVIKAIKIKEQKDIALYKDYENIADLILFDSTSMEKSQSIPKDLLSKLPKAELPPPIQFKSFNFFGIFPNSSFI